MVVYSFSTSSGPKNGGIVINFIILGTLGHGLPIGAIYFCVEFPGLILLNSKGFIYLKH